MGVKSGGTADIPQAAQALHSCFSVAHSFLRIYFIEECLFSSCKADCGCTLCRALQQRLDERATTSRECGRNWFHRLKDSNAGRPLSLEVEPPGSHPDPLTVGSRGVSATRLGEPGSDAVLCRPPPTVEYGDD